MVCQLAVVIVKLGKKKQSQGCRHRSLQYSKAFSSCRGLCDEPETVVWFLKRKTACGEMTCVGLLNFHLTFDQNDPYQKGLESTIVIPELARKGTEPLV